MTVRKLSVAIDDDVATAATAAAARRGMSLSAWLTQAASNALAIDDGLAAVAGWEADHGALTADELAAADAVLDRPTSTTRRRAS